MSTRQRSPIALDTIFAACRSAAELASVPDVPMAQGHAPDDRPPGAESVIAFGLPGLARKDKDYVPAVVMNHILGGGSSTSRLWTQVAREARPRLFGPFQLSPSAHSALLAVPPRPRTSARLNPLR